MATTPAPNPRASLLAGLRTGGVRSTSGPTSNVPHTAAPGGAFNVPRFVPNSHNDALFSHEEEDELSDMMAQNLYIKNNVSRFQQHPMTAAVDGAANRFSNQQAIGMNGMGFNSMTPAAAQNQLQALQLQMMQMEIARLQALQAQQYQAELLAQVQAQAQRQRQAQQPLRRTTVGFVPPASAGPTQGMFDMGAASMNAQMRRANQAELLRAKLGVGAEEQVPMTAALGGKFGSRLSSRYESDEDDLSSTRAKPPLTPNYTTVISGGTSLGHLASNNISGNGSALGPSKSDAAVSWRRSNTNHSMLGGNRAASSPLVKITPPPGEPSSPGSAKARPHALQLSVAASQPLPATIVIDNSEGTDGEDSSSMSSRSNSSPSTPQTASSSDVPPLSPREEAVKKLYEGLGLGRPTPTIAITAPQDAPVQRLVSQPVRQPRGPPSNNDDLLPKNFATRSRRKAIGALGALMGARERREVEVF
ncbi:hypothetical protein AcV5_000905 [Taiwanofungus camphoratus]|nr:hypothetical protein AcV5_000905 [Antrodia cinnamomea]